MRSLTVVPADEVGELANCMKEESGCRVHYSLVPGVTTRGHLIYLSVCFLSAAYLYLYDLFMTSPAMMCILIRFEHKEKSHMYSSTRAGA